MKYMGSKERIAKHILPIILKDRKPEQWYVADIDMLGEMLVYAARYAHHRETGAANRVVSCILGNWDLLNERHKVQITNEASEASCNKTDWCRITHMPYYP